MAERDSMMEGASPVAALYVQSGGVYYGLDGVDPWDEERDARTYAGDHPVVAHPPCGRWCKIAPINVARGRFKLGEDGGCFAAALAAVRKWGGVLEHPAGSYAWAAHGLPRPFSRGWRQDWFDEGVVCEVDQAQYGHSAQKPTWLYAVRTALPDLLWGKGTATKRISFLNYKKGDGGVGHILRQREASATPIAFRNVLIGMVRDAHG